MIRRTDYAHLVALLGDMLGEELTCEEKKNKRKSLEEQAVYKQEPRRRCSSFREIRFINVEGHEVFRETL